MRYNCGMANDPRSPHILSSVGFSLAFDENEDLSQFTPEQIAQRFFHAGFNYRAKLAESSVQWLEDLRAALPARTADQSRINYAYEAIYALRCAKTVTDWVAAIMAESRGLDGFHLNGNICDWDDAMDDNTARAYNHLRAATEGMTEVLPVSAVNEAMGGQGGVKTAAEALAKIQLHAEVAGRVEYRATERESGRFSVEIMDTDLARALDMPGETRKRLLGAVVGNRRLASILHDAHQVLDGPVFERGTTPAPWDHTGRLIGSRGHRFIAVMVDGTDSDAKPIEIHSQEWNRAMKDAELIVVARNWFADVAERYRNLPPHEFGYGAGDGWNPWPSTAPRSTGQYLCVWPGEANGQPIAYFAVMEWNGRQFVDDANQSNDGMTHWRYVTIPPRVYLNAETRPTHGDIPDSFLGTRQLPTPIVGDASAEKPKPTIDLREIFLPGHGNVRPMPVRFEGEPDLPDVTVSMKITQGDVADFWKRFTDDGCGIVPKLIDAQPSAELPKFVIVNPDPNCTECAGSGTVWEPPHAGEEMATARPCKCVGGDGSTNGPA